MKLDNEELAGLFNDRSIRLPRPTPGCPEAELFRRVAQGEAAAAQREELADHLVSCADCSEQYRLIVQLRSWANGRETSGTAADSQRPSRRSLSWISALAASLLIAAGLSLFLRLRPPSAPVASRDRGPATAALAVDPPDRALLAAAPSRLAWEPVEGADGYEVTLYDFESSPIWESPPISRAEIAFPDFVRKKIESGGRFYWRVTVRKGIDRLPSQLHEFEVSAGRPG